MIKKLNIHQQIKDKLAIFLKNNNVPHLLFYGPPGAGKKTLVNDFIDQIYENQNEYKQNVMKVNCAFGKGIQLIIVIVLQSGHLHKHTLPQNSTMQND